MSFKKIHQEILKKSSKFRIVKNEIEKNGIIKIQKSKLDLFSFITKNIISHSATSIIDVVHIIFLLNLIFGRYLLF